MLTVLELLSSGGTRRKPKIAKGTRDFEPAQMRVRQQAFEAIRNERRHRKSKPAWMLKQPPTKIP